LSIFFNATHKHLSQHSEVKFHSVPGHLHGAIPSLLTKGSFNWHFRSQHMTNSKN